VLIFEAIFQEIDNTMTTYVNSTVADVVAYVDGPITLLAAIAFIVMGFMLLKGIGDIPVAVFVRTSGALALVAALAGSVGNYNQYIATHLSALPDDLYALLAGVSGQGATSIGQNMDDVAAKVVNGINAVWAASGWDNLGGYFTAATLFVVLLIFGVAAIASVGIMKIGISLVVAIGPLMILGLLFRSTQEYFTKWVTYAVQFGLLGALIGGIAGMSQSVIETFIQGIDQSQANTSIVIYLAPALILLMMAYIFSQHPSMASSLSGGIGLSAGNAAWNGMRAAGYSLSGGRYRSAASDALRYDRVEGARRIMRGAEDRMQSALRRNGEVSRGSDAGARFTDHAPGSLRDQVDQGRR
jgi:type IV secretion system protein VirB6